MIRGPPPSDDEEDYDGFQVTFSYEPEPAPYRFGLEERDDFFEKLKRSVTSGNLELLQECFHHPEYIINVNVKLFDDWTPLLLACRSGDLDCVDYLLRQGAKIGLDCNDTTCLMAACEAIGDQMEILRLVEFLVEKGAAVDHQNCRQMTALMIACCQGLTEVVRFLVKRADLEIVDRNHWTALFHAVDCNQMEIIQILLDNGAATNLEDQKGYTLYQVAEMKGFHDILQLLPAPKQEYIIPYKYLNYSSVRELVPSGKGENPSYYPDVKPILYGSGCEYLIDTFAQNWISLFECLTMTYSKLEDLQIGLPFERKKILHGIYRFHSMPWSTSSLNKVAEDGRFDIFDALTIATTNLKHSVILLASCHHILSNNRELGWEIPSTDSVQKVQLEINCLRKQIKAMRKTVTKVPNETLFTEISFLANRLTRSKSMNKFLISACVAFGIGCLIRMCPYDKVLK